MTDVTISRPENVQLLRDFLAKKSLDTLNGICSALGEFTRRTKTRAIDEILDFPRNIQTVPYDQRRTKFLVWGYLICPDWGWAPSNNMKITLAIIYDLSVVHLRLLAAKLDIVNIPKRKTELLVIILRVLRERGYVSEADNRLLDDPRCNEILASSHDQLQLMLGQNEDNRRWNKSPNWQLMWEIAERNDKQKDGRELHLGGLLSMSDVELQALSIKFGVEWKDATSFPKLVKAIRTSNCDLVDKKYMIYDEEYLSFYRQVLP